MSDPRRQITVTLSGQAVRDGRVSVGLLTKTLQSMQQALFQIGKAKVEREASRRGPAPTLVQRQCELFFTGTRVGSLTATLELPPPESSLFPEFQQDVGEEALRDLRVVIEGIAADNPEPIRGAIPDARHRSRVVSTVSSVLPRQGADYNLAVQVGDFPCFPQVLRPPRERLRALIGLAEVTEAELPPEEVLIDAVCRARLRQDMELSPRDITAVIEYERIEAPDLRPYRLVQVEWGSRRLELRHEIACSVSREGDLYVLEYEPLGIRAYAESREAAIGDFNEEFLVLWDEYRGAPHDELTPDAIELKGRLTALVTREVRSVED